MLQEAVVIKQMFLCNIPPHKTRLRILLVVFLTGRWHQRNTIVLSICSEHYFLIPQAVFFLSVKEVFCTLGWGRG